MTNQSTIRAREVHHKALEALYLETTGSTFNGGGKRLWQRLSRIEKDFTSVSISYCNGTCSPGEREAEKDRVTLRIKRLFDGKLPKGFHLNSDPRGYALKLDSELRVIPEGMQRDWGGYGILAPIID